MAEKKIPDGLMAELIEAGLSNQQIVDELWKRRQTRITRQGVSAWRKRNGYPMQDKIDLNWCPWEVLPEHRQDEVYRVLRWTARKAQGLPISKEGEARVRSGRNFLAKLDFDAVFLYNPEKEGGPWFVVPRVEGDRGIMATAPRK